MPTIDSFASPDLPIQIDPSIFCHSPKSRSSNYLRSRQLLLQESLLDEILGPSNENIPRLKKWASDLFSSEPKLATSLLIKLLPSSQELATPPSQEVNNTLVIIDQSSLSPPSLSPPSLPEERVNSAFSLQPRETNLIPSLPSKPLLPSADLKPKFRIKSRSRALQTV